MDIIEFKALLAKQQNGKKILQKFTPEISNKLNIILNSQDVYDYFMDIIYSQNDVERYVSLIKQMAQTQSAKYNYWLRTQDYTLKRNNPKQVIISDTLDFYEWLDELTSNKLNLTNRAKESINKTEFSYQIPRSNAKCVNENDKCIWNIQLNILPFTCNRTALIHEVWHTMSKQLNQSNNIRLCATNKLRRDYTILTNINNKELVDKFNAPLIDEYYIDQFTYEISTMFIEKLGTDFLLKKYPSDDLLKQKIKYAQTTFKNKLIENSLESYLDHLISLIICGYPEELQIMGIEKIAQNYNFFYNLIEEKIDQLYDVATNNPAKSMFHEFRYVIGEAIAQEMYVKFLIASKINDDDKRKTAQTEIITKMFNLTYNNYNIYKLKNKNSTAKNKVDIITEYLELPKIETLIKNLSEKIGKYHSSHPYINHPIDSPPIK